MPRPTTRGPSIGDCNPQTQINRNRYERCRRTCTSPIFRPVPTNSALPQKSNFPSIFHSIHLTPKERGHERVRVIAGKLKSRPLRALAGTDTRPTSDRLRETLFNVLTAGNPSALEGSIWLDVYAGTGAVGIEALSRGAHSVTFIENNRAAAKVIRENLNSLGVDEGFELLEHDAGRALRQLDAQALSCDCVFIDPPYRLHEAYYETLGFLSQSRILKPNSIAIAEHDKRHDPGESFGALVRYRKLGQGDSVLSFYRRIA